jgi:hypothetical protein
MTLKTSYRVFLTYRRLVSIEPILIPRVHDLFVLSTAQHGDLDLSRLGFSASSAAGTSAEDSMMVGVGHRRERG